jgi:hypothetical protein
MLLVSHTIIGVAIAVVIKQPLLAFPLAFLSHFLLDLIPHWDLLEGKLNGEDFTGARGKDLLFILVDFLIGLGVGLLFAYRALPNTTLAVAILSSAFFANLPDGLLAPKVFFGKDTLASYYRLHHKLHTNCPLPWGIISQVVVATIGLLIALR